MRTSAEFTLLSPPVLSRNAAFRDEPLRIDVDGQRRGWPTAQLAVVDAPGRTQVQWLGSPLPGGGDAPGSAGGAGIASASGEWAAHPPR